MRDRAQPAARLTSRTYQLKAGWRQQPVWKTQSTAIENRLAGILGRVRGRNSINYELARAPLTTTTVRHRARPSYRSLVLSHRFCLSLSLSSLSLSFSLTLILSFSSPPRFARGSRLVIHKPQRELSARPELLEALKRR